MIGELRVLREVFEEIIIPPAVDLEIENLSEFSIILDEYHNSEWIIKKKPEDKNRVAGLREELDDGESEAIVLDLFGG